MVLQRGEAARPSRVALNHASKDLNAIMCILAYSALEHMMLLPPIYISRRGCCLCSHPHSEPIRLVSHGDVMPLARWPVSQRCAPVSREVGYDFKEMRFSHKNQKHLTDFPQMDSDNDLAMTQIWRDMPHVN